MHRRTLLVAALALAAAPAAIAQPKPPGKAVEAGKLFPYLVNYLKLPSAERTLWTLAYYFSLDGKPAVGATGWIDDAGQRVPITIGAGGRVERLPTLAQLQAKRPVRFDFPSGSKLSVNLLPEPLLRPAAEIAAADLIAALTQAAKGARKAAPLPVRALVPKFDTVYFSGAQGAEGVQADGRAAALPLDDGTPVFKPKLQPGVVTIRFKTPPRRMALG